MDEIITNWVILIDGTEIMSAKDFRPSRFQVALKGVQKFVQIKFKLFPNEFLSMYIFSDKTQIIAQLSRDSNDILKDVMSSKFIRNHKPKGTGNELFFALQHAVEMIRAQIQQIGGQKSRIILITGQEKFPNSDEMSSLLKLIKGLDIFLDIFLFSSKKANLIENYRPIIDQLNGQFHELTSRDKFYSSIIQYAKEKGKLSEQPNISFKSSQDRSEHLIEIAQNLRLPTKDELAKANDPLSMVRCQVCFSKKSPLNNKSLAVSGRYCPHCDIPIHLQCAGMWTDKTDEGANLFRCPYCFTLLKVPMYILKGVRSHNILHKSKDPESFLVKLVREKGLGNKLESHECAYCFRHFNSKKVTKIYRCSHCNAYYHVECLAKMYKKTKICQNCGRKIL
ncbi:MAG: VWA domain-containing protein [Promethearchaeota archaeon]